MSPANDVVYVGPDDADAPSVEVTVNNGVVTTTPILDDYFFKPGRPGGQTASGGSNTGDDLVLQANATSSADDRFITLHGNIVIALNDKSNSQRALHIDYSGAIITGANPEVFRFTGPAEIPTNSRYTFFNHIGTMLLPGANVPFVLFNISPAWRLTGVKTAGQIFFFAPSVGDDGAVRSIGINVRGIILNPVLSALTAGSTGTVSNLTAMDMAPTVDASWNPITLARFIAMPNPGGSHAVGITDYVGMDVADIVTKPTNVFTIRNLEDRAKMVHRGAGVFGDLGTTVPPAGVELEVRSTIGVFLAPRMSGVQAAALVGVVPDGSQVYVNVANGGFAAVGMYQMTGGAWVAM